MGFSNSASRKKFYATQNFKGYGKFMWESTTPIEKFRTDAVDVFIKPKYAKKYYDKKWNELPDYLKGDLANLWIDMARKDDKETIQNNR